MDILIFILVPYMLVHLSVHLFANEGNNVYRVDLS
jgi:hypothetical protein